MAMVGCAASWPGVECGCIGCHGSRPIWSCYSHCGVATSTQHAQQLEVAQQKLLPGFAAAAVAAAAIAGTGQLAGPLAG